MFLTCRLIAFALALGLVGVNANISETGSISKLGAVVWADDDDDGDDETETIVVTAKSVISDAITMGMLSTHGGAPGILMQDADALNVVMTKACLDAIEAAEAAGADMSTLRSGASAAAGGIAGIACASVSGVAAVACATAAVMAVNECLDPTDIE